MFEVGDKVVYYKMNNDGGFDKINGTVTYTFYEPGDPIQGLGIITDDGVKMGSIDSQDCQPVRLVSNN